MTKPSRFKLIDRGNCLLFMCEIFIKTNSVKSSRQEKSGKNEESFESADFPSHMESMMLACICNKYEVIMLMLQKGYKLEVPGEESQTASGKHG